MSKYLLAEEVVLSATIILTERSQAVRSGVLLTTLRKGRLLPIMGKVAGGGRSDSLHQDFRKKTGRVNAKIGKKEIKETMNTAIARKQEFPLRKILLGMVMFGAACAILYAYLTYVLADDDEDNFQ